MKTKREKLREKIYDLVYEENIDKPELYDNLISLLEDNGVYLDKLL